MFKFGGKFVNMNINKNKNRRRGGSIRDLQIPKSKIRCRLHDYSATTQLRVLKQFMNIQESTEKITTGYRQLILKRNTTLKIPN